MTKIKIPIRGNTRKKGPSQNRPLTNAVINQNSREEQRINQPDKLGFTKNKKKPTKIPVKESI